MSYISAEQIGDDVIVWERNANGREVKNFLAPYNFYVKDDKGKYESILGEKLSIQEFSTGKDFHKAKEDLKSSNIKLFESDIQPELKILSTYYNNVPAPDLNITFLDIEVDYNIDIGFSSVANPYAPINSIALYHVWSNETIVYAVPPSNYEGEWDQESISKAVGKKVPLPTDTNVVFHMCKNEKELLLYVLAEIEESDLLCGWNSEFFDMPYIGKRIQMVLGENHFRRLSFPEGKKPRYREVEVFGNPQDTLDLSGRISSDYLILFRKYEMAERPSYKLESISDEVLRDPNTKEALLPKLEYEGSLAKLYKEDFPYFLRYNIRDTEILKGLEERLGYVKLANTMYHISSGLYKHVGGTLKLADLATVNYCHDILHKIVPDVHIPEQDGRIKGAYVLEPKTGEKVYGGSVDLASLYPSSIRSLNMSPETIRGQFIEAILAAEHIASNSEKPITFVYEKTKEQLILPAREWRKKFIKLKWAVSGYGTVFDQNQQGVIPSILETWYATRKKYQKLKAEAGKAGDKNKEAYYDRLQYVYKIKLNSYYGALTNQYFRFYDLRLGESTTGTGRFILNHQCAKVNEILTGVYDRHGEAIIYGDTDSTYFLTFTDNDKDAIAVANRVGELVNESFPEFMRNTFLCNAGFDTIMETGREVVFDRGIFVEKKNYILHVIDDEGKKVDKLKVMGLATKKTTLPKEVATKLNNFMHLYLKSAKTWEETSRDIVEYKELLYNTDNIMMIGLPKGVKNVEAYTQQYQIYGDGARLPGHVAASIFYNICREQFGDMESLPIVSGMKIKVFYLDKMYGKFKSIALPVDQDEIPSWFTESFTVNRKMHIERLVDNPLGIILKSTDKEVPNQQSLLTNSILIF